MFPIYLFNRFLLGLGLNLGKLKKKTFITVEKVVTNVF